MRQYAQCLVSTPHLSPNSSGMACRCSYRLMRAGLTRPTTGQNWKSARLAPNWSAAAKKPRKLLIGKLLDLHRQHHHAIIFAVLSGLERYVYGGFSLSTTHQNACIGPRIGPSLPTHSAARFPPINGFQDRAIGAQSMRRQRQNRFQNKGESARLQAAFHKGRRFSFGIDFKGAH